MRVFFWFCLTLLLPGLLVRFPVGGAGILLSDVVLPIFALTWLCQKLLMDRSFPRNSFVRPGILFGCAAIFSFLLGAGDLELEEQFLSGAYVVRLFSLIFWGWAATDFFQERAEKFFQKFFWIAGGVIGLGFLQFYLVPDLSTWSTEGGWDPHIGRLLGTWMDPNFMAGFLGFLTPLALARWYRSTTKKGKIFLMLLIAASLGALFLTFSRSGYLAAAIGLFVFFLFRDPKIFVLAVAVIVLAVISNERATQRLAEFGGTVSAIVWHDTDEVDPTASLRLQSWQKSFDLWKKYPIFGIGYNTYRARAAEEGIVDEEYFSAGGSDSTHLTILVTTGVVGFLLYLWWWGKIFWVNFRRFFQNRNELFLGFATGLLALLVHAFFVNSLLFPLIAMPLLAAAGALEEKKS